MGICQSKDKLSKPYCPLCREFIIGYQLFRCVKCRRNYHIQCFTTHVDDMTTCPACNKNVVRLSVNGTDIGDILTSV